MGEKEGTALAAMMLGEKSGMDAEVKSLYQPAVSGIFLPYPACIFPFLVLGPTISCGRYQDPLAFRSGGDRSAFCIRADDRPDGICCPLPYHVSVPRRCRYYREAL